MHINRSIGIVRGVVQVAVVMVVTTVLSGQAARAESPVEPPSILSEDNAAGCRAEFLQAAADSVSDRISINEASNLVALKLPGGAKYFPESESLPGYCQVSGSFVTNPETGKTANFLATFPDNWNGKYLQYGCFGTCGFIVLNDAANPLVTIIAQGMPGDSLRKGYASFGTDEGHDSHEPASWAAKGPGEIDSEAIDDFLFRATQVLTPLAKQFTTAYYSKLTGKDQSIKRSYFNGCSGGGRDALLAAANYPEQFDGIIAGSPASDMAGISLHVAGMVLAAERSEDAAVPPRLVALIDPIVKARCDRLDGVEDGLIQNPAVCDFLPERDLPTCTDNSSGEDCFTPVQIETVSTALTAVTDEKGNVIQPGFSVSDFQFAGITGMAPEVLKVMAFGNPPAFSLDSVIDHTDQTLVGSSGYGTVVNRENIDKAMQGMSAGIVKSPEALDNLMETNTRLLIWHNLSDQLLTPYLSYNLYKQLADRNGGYEKLQEQVRLFAVPGTTHCSGGIGGVGPNSFDVLSAMEQWVEDNRAPNEIIATYFPGTKIGGKDFSQPPGRTMPLCKFPVMARYKGEGDINHAENWFCPADDQSMLKVGESGKRAGVIH